MGRSEVETGSDYCVTYACTNAAISADEVPEHDATVGEFALDKYEVTVGRFRKFVEVYDTWQVTNGNPKLDVGQHPSARNTGWGESWTAAATDLPESAAALTNRLKCSSAGGNTWKDTVGTADEENYPINCMNWYLAFAFCIWDGGRLPTEAEWEYAAAGGAENRLYPWGSAALDATRANHSGTDATMLVPVGKYPAGAGFFGHLDLAGSVWELAFDYYDAAYYGTSGAPVACSNCANIRGGSTRVVRGSGVDTDGDLRTAFRDVGSPAVFVRSQGFRCARVP